MGLLEKECVGRWFGRRGGERMEGGSRRGERSGGCGERACVEARISGQGMFPGGKLMGGVTWGCRVGGSRG